MMLPTIPYAIRTQIHECCLPTHVVRAKKEKKKKNEKPEKFHEQKMCRRKNIYLLIPWLMVMVVVVHVQKTYRRTALSLSRSIFTWA